MGLPKSASNDYTLFNVDGNEVKLLNVSSGGEVSFSFTRNGEAMTFALQEDDIRHSTNKHLVDLPFPADFVQASVEDPNVAVVVENRLVGLKPGKTELRLYMDVDKTVVTCPITVK